MTLAELEAQRKLQAKTLGVRYYRLTKQQAMAALCKANAPKKRLPYPFP